VWNAAISKNRSLVDALKACTYTTCRIGMLRHQRKGQLLPLQPSAVPTSKTLRLFESASVSTGLVLNLDLVVPSEYQNLSDRWEDQVIPVQVPRP
jgi:hypothetical protein